MGVDQWQRASMFRRGKLQEDASFLEPGEVSRPSRPPPPPLTEKELLESAQRFARARLKERVVSPQMAGLGLSAALLAAVLDNLGPQAGAPADDDAAGVAPEQAAARGGGSSAGGAGIAMAGAETASGLDQGGSDAGIVTVQGPRVAATVEERPVARGTTIIPSNILRSEGDAWAVREAGLSAVVIGQAGLLAEAASGLGLMSGGEARAVGGVDAALLMASQTRAVAEAGKAAKAAEGAKALAQGEAKAGDAAQSQAAPGDTVHVAPARAVTVAVSQDVSGRTSQAVADADDGVVAWAAPVTAGPAQSDGLMAGLATGTVELVGLGVAKAAAPVKVAAAEAKADRGGSVAETAPHANAVAPAGHAASAPVVPAKVAVVADHAAAAAPSMATGAGHAGPAGAVVTDGVTALGPSTAAVPVALDLVVPGVGGGTSVAPVAGTALDELGPAVAHAANPGTGTVGGNQGASVGPVVGPVIGAVLGGLDPAVAHATKPETGTVGVDQGALVGPAVGPVVGAVLGDGPGVVGHAGPAVADPMVPAGGPVAEVTPGAAPGGPVGVTLGDVLNAGHDTPAAVDPVVPANGPVVDVKPAVDHAAPHGPVGAVLGDVLETVGHEVPAAVDPVVPANGPVVDVKPVVDHAAPGGPDGAVLGDVLGTGHDTPAVVDPVVPVSKPVVDVTPVIDFVTPGGPVGHEVSAVVDPVVPVNKPILDVKPVAGRDEPAAADPVVSTGNPKADAAPVAVDPVVKGDGPVAEHDVAGPDAAPGKAPVSPADSLALPVAHQEAAGDPAGSQGEAEPAVLPIKGPEKAEAVDSGYQVPAGPDAFSFQAVQDGTDLASSPPMVHVLADAEPGDALLVDLTPSHEVLPDYPVLPDYHLV